MKEGEKKRPESNISARGHQSQGPTDDSEAQSLLPMACINFLIEIDLCFFQKVNGITDWADASQKSVQVEECKLLCF